MGLNVLENENPDGSTTAVQDSEVPLEHRIEWLIRARKGAFSEYITQSDLDKYINRGLIKMPWTEMSQEEFLEYVTSFPAELPKLMEDDKMLQVSLSLMEQVVRDPERLYRSVYKVLHNKDYRTLEVSQHSKGNKDGINPNKKDSA